MKWLIKPLTVEEKEEAIWFIKLVLEMWYDKFNEYKKSNRYWRKLLNWCRIRKEYPELNKEWEEKFVKPDKEKKIKENEENLIIRIAINKSKFIKEHLIENSNINDVKYYLIKEEVGEDNQVLIWIPFSHSNLTVNKFGYSIWVNQKYYPNRYKDIISNYPRYTGEANVYSNSPKYWQTFRW